MTEPKILSRHRVGRYMQVTKFLTRYGDVTWFLDYIDATGELGENVYQGDFAGAKIMLRSLGELAREYRDGRVVEPHTLIACGCPKCRFERAVKTAALLV